ncbi:MAG: methyltransferase domain-containing protein [Candidatus Iainarchaeum archaeon]|uniref:Methyltransferase domain-containing protein n=1 Tax=Candidatus Iainarchaeum sp. TaxID=3101447 RepID=A0A7T9I260_9ARCH|nr:MAG: methyltransferase domain-containing protein [Candidatus Diapherotrites archaeon]
MRILQLMQFPFLSAMKGIMYYPRKGLLNRYNARTRMYPMNDLPSPEVYEKEFKYMPWGELINDLLQLIERDVKPQSELLDLMCGPGYLLSKISTMRPDLKLTGVDIDKRYTHYTRNKYSSIECITADVLKWQTNRKFDTIVCTGGIHHIPYPQQHAIVQKIFTLLNDDGFCIVADPYVSDYSNEEERKLAAAELGYEYLAAVIRKNAPNEIITAAVDILENDLFMTEYKTSVKKNTLLFKKYFSSVEIHKTWPKKESEYGDYYFILKKSTHIRK